MAKWVRDDADYQIPIPNHEQAVDIHVSGLRDESHKERDILVLSDNVKNPKRSILETEVLTASVQHLAGLMNSEPHQSRWFALDQDGGLHSIITSYEVQSKTNPQYTGLANSGDLNHIDLEYAKKYFPDIKCVILGAKLQPVGSPEQQAVSKAFGSAKGIDPGPTR